MIRIKIKLREGAQSRCSFPRFVCIKLQPTFLSEASVYTSPCLIPVTSTVIGPSVHIY